ncbi:hypothetical protein [Acanthopleuribacter pedis]|uniref:Uncharacterized protein n=1 Tax=Acanthopleuribacter pedis TaxID=442870 RepID=A0A8J7U497_9BACT|nr:hypothetical protein [Acanthopleuribacter pedis]MBO1320417.1 hypothetical protein [Acanthopleuribacter pedis]
MSRVFENALFVYHIHYDNLVYYHKRYQFFQAAARAVVGDLLIIYDSRAMPHWNRTPYTRWAERVYFMDYHQLVRERVDFEKKGFLDGTLAEIRSWARELGAVDWVFGYQLRYSPLVKMVVETVLETEPNCRLCELEDGLFDYLVAEAPERFQLKDVYAGSRFTDTPYHGYFSLEPPRVVRERFYFSLFHPELIQRSFSRQIHVAELFDFPGAVLPGPVLEDTVVTSPNLRGDVSLFIDFNEQVSRKACDLYWATLHPFSFWYREAEVLPLVAMVRRAGSVGIIGPHASSLGDALAEMVPEVSVRLCEEAAGAEAGIGLWLVTGNSSEPRTGSVPMIRVTDDDIRFLAEGRDWDGDQRRQLPLLADEPFERYTAKRPVVYFSALVPFEFMSVRQSVVISASSSLSYRVRHIQPDNASYVVVPAYETEHPRWDSRRIVPAEEWDVWARVFSKMGVGVYRNDAAGRITPSPR